ncbi:hypothetical protein ACFQH2_03670 [Natronoarchaeum sp. GCM10025703]|uniref:hypothetical protein n=1 Tax=Natronoarchaeum sp. GCM10025703 TaxID=3252685 RepID=UPI00361B700C
MALDRERLAVDIVPVVQVELDCHVTVAVVVGRRRARRRGDDCLVAVEFGVETHLRTARPRHGKFVPDRPDIALEFAKEVHMIARRKFGLVDVAVTVEPRAVGADHVVVERPVDHEVRIVIGGNGRLLDRKLEPGGPSVVLEDADRLCPRAGSCQREFVDAGDVRFERHDRRLTDGRDAPVRRALDSPPILLVRLGIPWRELNRRSDRGRSWRSAGHVLAVSLDLPKLIVMGTMRRSRAIKTVKTSCTGRLGAAYVNYFFNNVYICGWLLIQQ